MSYAIHVDRFTSLDDLTQKERRDTDAVLATLRQTRRFSVWDMDNRDICNTVSGLLASGRVRQLEEGERGYLGFPWVAVEIREPAAKEARHV